MRVMRKDAGERLRDVLELIGSAADVLGQNGWDAVHAGPAAEA